MQITSDKISLALSRREQEKNLAISHLTNPKLHLFSPGTKLLEKGSKPPPNLNVMMNSLLIPVRRYDTPYITFIDGLESRGMDVTKKQMTDVFLN